MENSSLERQETRFSLATQKLIEDFNSTDLTSRDENIGTYDELKEILAPSFQMVKTVDDLVSEAKRIRENLRKLQDLRRPSKF